MPSDTQVIYSMMRVGRIHPPNKQVLRDISLGFYYGAKIGVLGLNGAGKSTLLRIMAGVDKDYVGEIAMSKGYTVGLLEQEPQLDDSKTVIEVVREAVQPIVDMLAKFDAVNAKFAEPDADFDLLVAEQTKLQEALDKVDAWNLDSHLELAMEALRCPPPEAPVKVLSGGERRRVALTRLLLTEPDILLLDEPTNHLDAESVAWLEHHLRDYKGTVIAVTHDRYFLDNVAGWILELDRGYGIQESFPDAAAWKENNVKIRMVAYPKLIQINTPGFTGDFSLLLSNNTATGGTCYGDSGGPNFLYDSLVVAGVTSFGLNPTCGGTGGVFRMDRQDVLDFVTPFLE